MHCYDHHKSYRPCDSSRGSYSTPEFVLPDLGPVTNIATITAISNALSLGVLDVRGA